MTETEGGGGTRRVIPWPGHQQQLEALGVEFAARVRAVLRALQRDAFLPGGDDLDVLIPPHQVAFRRKVPGTDYWVFYTATEAVLKVWAVKRVDRDAGLVTKPPPKD